MSLPTSNLKLTQALSEFRKNTPGSMSDLAGESASPTNVPNIPYKMSDLFGKQSIVEEVIRISSNTSNWRLSNQGLSSSNAYDLTIIVEENVIVSSTSTSSSALGINQTFADNSNITLINYGTIVGRGGKGGYASTERVSSGCRALTTSGNNGGHGVYVSSDTPTHIDNNERIGGGGGGGGAGAATLNNARENRICASGGGGGGYGDGGDTNPVGSDTTDLPGDNGGAFSGGSGYSGSRSATIDKTTYTCSASGGDGGGPGNSGNSGSASTDSGGSCNQSSSGGGSPGNSVQATSNASVTTSGSGYFGSVNT